MSLPASVSDLRKGSKVSATKIVEEQRTEISTDGFITGRLPSRASRQSS